MLDTDVGRREAHAVGHVDVDRAGGLGGHAGLADRLVGLVAVTTGVGAGCRSARGGQGQECCESGLAEGVFHGFPLR
ncbi:hypothetical protein, partial [Bosea sp. (in: a-proteobacteria)]|uniref:hypothetical protein n=1 Tax=Bosea sp. (in: a-proteobacteria) TaxID=1871050 RepID=UPI003F6EF67E